MAEGKKLELSPQERKRRSDRARALVKEGKLGGPNQGQGRKRTEKANEKLAREAARHSQKMLDRLLDIIENGKNAEALNAMKMWIEIEATETSRKDKERVSELEGKSKDELMKFVFEKLLERDNSGDNPVDFVEGRAEDITDVKVIESGD